MTGQELRQKFLNFFEKNNHTIIPSASLIPSEEEQLAGKERVLFTSAGMQPLIPYLMGKPHPKGKKLANVQKCLRTDDIEEVGDATHHTFFEMLGNWSLGAYWKDEAIRLSFEFLTKELEISVEKLAISVFAGDENTPRDEESARVWESLGIPKERIFYFGKEYNWWPTGEKSGPCGPDTEMFYWVGESDPEGRPNENPLWVEIWNDVFMQFNHKDDGSLEDLPQKNVDTGMGLERMLMVLQKKDSVFGTDVFEPLLKIINSDGKLKEDRILLDHLRAAVMMIADGVEPSNKDQGYVLRKLIRRAIAKSSKGLENVEQKEMQNNLFVDSVKNIVKAVVLVFKDTYPDVEREKSKIIQVLTEEVDRFSRAVGRGLHELEKLGPTISGGQAFNLYQSFGFPIELTEDLAKDRGWSVDREGFKEELRKHQEKSRTAATGKFAGGLAGRSETEIKYHTATHLLHQALRDVLGAAVFQKGSNITAERLRFDFSFDRKMTDEEIKQAEDLVNQRIKDDLKVDHMTVPLNQAKSMNAIGLFDEKYADKVSIYGVGPGYNLDPKAKDQRDRGGYYSLEFCGGPHVEHTGVIGKVKIVKEEAISAGIRRIRATLV